MNAKKCDRCGSFFDLIPKKTGGALLFENKNDNTYDILNASKRDLCQDCMVSLQKWFNAGKDTEGRETK